jgi:hypothetical protein
LNGTVFWTPDIQVIVVANTNLGSNISAAQTLINIDKAVYSSAEITASSKTPTGNVQTQKMLVSYNSGTNTAISTVYGTVSAPAGANLGVFTSEVTGSNVNIRFTQTAPNTSIKVIAHLIK